MRSFTVLYSSPDIIMMIKSRRARWAGHVARMGEIRNIYNVLVGRAEGRKPLGGPRYRCKNNIQIYLRKLGLRCGLDLSGSRKGPVAGSCEHGKHLCVP
jgi:hypothetical protein